MKGTVFNIQRFSLHDGPGVRTVVFLKGCPLRCVWCHNPEGLSCEPQIMYDSGKCIGCGDCISVCPSGCHEITDGLHFFDRTDCTACGECASVCPCEALSIAGRDMSVDEVMAEVSRDSSLYRVSDGGLTLSGGEPLYQPEFALALLKSAKETDMSTCIETCGAAKPEIISAAAGYTDLFLYDYKATGDEDHKRFCGSPQKLILENLSLLDRLGAQVILRCPIIPGFNQKDEHIDGIAKTALEHPCVKEVHLEPFHRLGKTKAVKLGIVDAFDSDIPGKSELCTYCGYITDISGKYCKAN